MRKSLERRGLAPLETINSSLQWLPEGPRASRAPLGEEEKGPVLPGKLEFSYMSFYFRNDPRSNKKESVSAVHADFPADRPDYSVVSSAPTSVTKCDAKMYFYRISAGGMAASVNSMKVNAFFFIFIIW